MKVAEQDAFIKQHEASTFPITCPVGDCSKPINTRLSLIQHLGRSHDIHTDSYRKAPRNKNKGKKAKAVEATNDHLLPAVIPPMEKDMIAGPGEVGIDGILKVIFPEGIPFHKISPAVKWIDASRDLVD